MMISIKNIFLQKNISPPEKREEILYIPIIF